MKRAAGQIRKARKGSSKGNDKDNADAVQQQQQQQQQDLQQQQLQAPVRRKPTNEEAALTAKNYRLAKELVCFPFFCACFLYCMQELDLTGCFPFLQSDLRVRHREECKAVSRMTMENVSHINTVVSFYSWTNAQPVLSVPNLIS